MNPMCPENQVVSQSQAEELCNVGMSFSSDEYCYGYDDGGDLISSDEYYLINIYAPLKSQVFDYCLLAYNLQCFTNSNTLSGGEWVDWSFTIRHPDGYYYTVDPRDGFDTKQEAESSCIDMLILIINEESWKL